MIVSFPSAETERIWHGRFSRVLPSDIQRMALRKLRIMNNAKLLRDLAVPPNNHLEAPRARSFQVAFNLKRKSPSQTETSERDCFNLKLSRSQGDRAGQHSIRINQQWRICFVWTQGGPDRVEIVDYH